MQRTRTSAFGAIALLSASVLVGTGCETQGPAEKAGERAGQAVDNAADALNPKGPMEKAGEKVDNAVNR